MKNHSAVLKNYESGWNKFPNLQGISLIPSYLFWAHVRKNIYTFPAKFPADRNTAHFYLPNSKQIS